MKPISLQCDRMARVASEYCNMIQEFEEVGTEGTWLRDMEKLLPRLHVAVIALTATEKAPYNNYHFPDDDQRCELYLRLHKGLLADPRLWVRWCVPGQHRKVCDRLADDFTDMYFDLKRGLELLQARPYGPKDAESLWQCGFYLHWGQHLLDAEYWLRALVASNCFVEMSGSSLAWSYEDQNHNGD